MNCWPWFEQNGGDEFRGRITSVDHGESLKGPYIKFTVDNGVGDVVDYVSFPFRKYGDLELASTFDSFGLKRDLSLLQEFTGRLAKVVRKPTKRAGVDITFLRAT